MMRIRNNQKKLWAVLSILLVTMVVSVGCRKEEPSEPEPSPTSPTGRDTVDKGVDYAKINEVAEGVFALEEVNLMDILGPQEQQRFRGQSSSWSSNPRK